MGWRNLFRRAAPPARPASIETWHVGDLGECICDRWERPVRGDPKLGDIVRVRALRMCGACLYLEFQRSEPWVAYRADCFRRIIVSHEPAEAEFAKLIKRPARALQPERAMP